MLVMRVNQPVKANLPTVEKFYDFSTVLEWGGKLLVKYLVREVDCSLHVAVQGEEVGLVLH